MRTSLEGKKILKVYVVDYIFKDFTANSKTSSIKMKEYYERNSRNKIEIEITKRNIKVPFNHEEFKEAIQYVKKSLPSGFDVYIHSCNPNRSHTGGSTIITHVSSTNFIHEFGHALGLGHAVTNTNGTTQGSKDPYSQMTMYVPYKSMNSVHLSQFKWFEDTEKIQCEFGKLYTLDKMTNFSDKFSLKVLTTVINEKPYYISYVDKNNVNFIAIHSIIGEKRQSILIGNYEAKNNKEIFNVTSGLNISIKETNGNKIQLIVNKKEEDIELSSDCGEGIEEILSETEEIEEIEETEENKKPDNKKNKQDNKKNNKRQKM